MVKKETFVYMLGFGILVGFLFSLLATRGIILIAISDETMTSGTSDYWNNTGTTVYLNESYNETAWGSNSTGWNVILRSNGDSIFGNRTGNLFVMQNLSLVNQFLSLIATGTAPFQIASTTLNANLNADLLDGNHASAFALFNHWHNDTYYTKDEINATTNAMNTTIAGKAALYHTHTASNITDFSASVLSITNPLYAALFHTHTASNITDFTEASQDAIGGAFANTGTINLTYNDAGNSISANVVQGGIDHGNLAGLTNDTHTQYLLASGARALTGNWMAGAFWINANNFTSTVATGTAPLSVTSTTKVSNLNVEQVDGYDLNQAVQTTSTPKFTRLGLGTAADATNVLQLLSNSVIGSSGNVTINLSGTSNTALNITNNDTNGACNVTLVDGNLSLASSSANIYIPYNATLNWKYGGSAGLIAPATGANTGIFAISSSLTTGLFFDFVNSMILFQRGGSATQKFDVSAGGSGDIHSISGSNDIMLDASLSRINTSYAGLNTNLSGSSFVQQSVTATDLIRTSTTETNFSSSYFTIPANSLKAGNVIRITARGVYSCIASAPGLTLKLYFGNTVIGTTSQQQCTAVTNEGWAINFDVVVDSIGGSGTFEGQGFATMSSANNTTQQWSMENTATITVSTAASAVLSLSAKWSVSSASDAIQMRQFMVEIL